MGAGPRYLGKDKLGCGEADPSLLDSGAWGWGYVPEDSFIFYQKRLASFIIYCFYMNICIYVYIYSHKYKLNLYNVTCMFSGLVI